ncbi:hypothetical protein D3C80_829010 [compost metagenome]
MLHRHVRVFVDEERAAHRETGIIVRFGNAGHLQQMQRTAAGADEYEFRVHHLFGIGLGVGIGHAPAAIGIALNVGNLAIDLKVEILVALQMRYELAGDFAEFHVGAERRPGRADLLGRIAAFHHQRHPLLDLLGIGGEFHTGEKRAGFESLITLFQIGDVLVTPDEAHMRRVVDEGARVLQDAVAHLPGPELPGNLEGFVDVDGLGDLDVAVVVFRRVVELGKRGVAGAGIVPAVRAFKRHAVQPFQHLHRPGGLQFAQPNTERRAHDAAADQKHIDLLGGRIGEKRRRGQRRCGNSGERTAQNLSAVQRKCIGKISELGFVLIDGSHGHT